MTEEEVALIDLEKELDPQILKQVIAFWQTKALEFETELKKSQDPSDCKCRLN